MSLVHSCKKKSRQTLSLSSALAAPQILLRTGLLQPYRDTVIIGEQSIHIFATGGKEQALISIYVPILDV